MAQLTMIPSRKLRDAMGSFFCIVISAALLIAPAAQAQSYNVVHPFTGGSDGGYPYFGLTKDRAGNFYGALNYGGIYGNGLIYKLSRDGSTWLITPLYSFKGGDDGAAPYASPIFGPDGALYGTTSTGGSSGYYDGTVYRLAPPASACKAALCEWSETVLYRAATDQGCGVTGQPAFDRAGNLYGTVGGCGAHQGGYVFQLSPTGGGWNSQVLYAFNPIDSNDCNDPQGGVVLDAAGNLFGTANTGCVGNNGGVWEVTQTPSGWTEIIVHSFDNRRDGNGSTAGLTPDGHGNFFGTTMDLGPSGGGTVFELTPLGQVWTLSVVHAFSDQDQNGRFLNAPVSLDAAGNIYGTTVGCLGYRGTVFKLMLSDHGWTATVLYRFTGGADGGDPVSSVVMDASGNLYGTASDDGAHNVGVIWQITP
jgi:uncharacterized repeat protein (TIGR03803 family)